MHGNNYHGMLISPGWRQIEHVVGARTIWPDQPRVFWYDRPCWGPVRRPPRLWYERIPAARTVYWIAQRPPRRIAFRRDEWLMGLYWIDRSLFWYERLHGS